MENIAYYNGKISSIEEMMIPMNERSSYFGDGVYDAMFTVDHVPLQLDDHLRRFYRSAKKIDIDIPMPFEELRAMVLDFCRKIDSPDAMAYVQATRGVGMRGHAYRFAGGTPSAPRGSAAHTSAPQFVRENGGFATMTSNFVKDPSLFRSPGARRVSPRTILKSSMSWRNRFMRAMALVVRLTSWP